MFERSGRKEVTFEASREIAKPKTMLKPRKVCYYILAYAEIQKLGPNTSSDFPIQSIFKQCF